MLKRIHKLILDSTELFIGKIRAAPLTAHEHMQPTRGYLTVTEIFPSTLSCSGHGDSTSTNSILVIYLRQADSPADFRLLCPKKARQSVFCE